MDAKIDPKVVMDLSIFKIGGWNSLQPNNQNLLEKFIDENEPWLLIGIPSRDPFLVTQYLERHSVNSDQHMKKLMSLTATQSRHYQFKEEEIGSVRGTVKSMLTHCSDMSVFGSYW